MTKPIVPNRALRLLRRIAERAMQDEAMIVRPRVVDDNAGGNMPHPDGPLRIKTPCSFFAVRELPPGPVRDQLIEHGKYGMTVPLTKAVLASDQVELFGNTYQVTWAPPAGALDVERLVSLEEA